MQESQIIDQLAHNAQSFRLLFEGIEEEMYRWKPQANKWCLLEILCHLYDEEIEDFRARVQSSLKKMPPPPIDPEAWVSERNYFASDYDVMLDRFLSARAESIQWLKHLPEPKWNNAHVHPELGPRPAGFYLANWLAHDYLHVRQIMKLKYQYWQVASGVNFAYAGGV
ncbi:MAG: DinB family protein [Bacteroidota bacterium]